jgi:hypothetical protein
LHSSIKGSSSVIYNFVEDNRLYENVAADRRKKRASSLKFMGRDKSLDLSALAVINITQKKSRRKREQGIKGSNPPAGGTKFKGSTTAGEGNTKGVTRNAG